MQKKARARMFKVPGKPEINSSSILAIDKDYQMIDAHVDETMRNHILSFEYIDLSKRLSKSRAREEDQQLEIVNCNGSTFLSPISERESVQINLYGKWEQAFCVYTNIITSKYPGKASELLQYNHTIQLASTAYVWDNVYSYDKEFRYHVSHHPTRVWNVILQQAWTMILKDRLKHELGQNNQRGKKKEICKHFNQGCCTYGLSCRYEHCCSVKKCGKFGHGAHICRLRESGSNTLVTQGLTHLVRHQLQNNCFVLTLC